MDENLYDEFGNYIGPDLDEDDEEGDEWLEPLSKVGSAFSQPMLNVYSENYYQTTMVLLVDSEALFRTGGRGHGNGWSR